MIDDVVPSPNRRKFRKLRFQMIDDTLDSGERSAIALALPMQTTQILVDDSDGRMEAERRNLKVAGTLGILVEAHRRGLLDFDSALARLSGTSFYLSPRLVDMVRRLF
jgi:predicted nucleic acid-binding protein